MQTTKIDRLVPLLVSWPFVGAVLILLLNDTLLKYTYPGIVTGKLSDFCGVYLVSAVLFWVLPNRYWLAASLFACLFVYWKSAQSQIIIDFINSFRLVRFGRTIDRTDLLALFMIPITPYFVSMSTQSLRNRATNSICASVVGALFVFSLVGTSVLMPLQEVVLSPDETGIELSLPALNESIAKVASANELTCESCTPNSTEGSWIGNDLRLEYWINTEVSTVKVRTTNFGIRGFFIWVMPDERPVERINEELERVFASRSYTFEVVSSLGMGDD